jgi:hypothetical protein
MKDLPHKTVVAAIALAIPLAALAQSMESAAPGQPSANSRADQAGDQDSTPAMSGTIPTPTTTGTTDQGEQSIVTGTGQAQTSGTDPIIPIPHIAK